MKSSVIERLAKYSSEATETGCIEWSGYRDGYGYGRIKVDGVQRRAHQVSYEACKGEIPVGLLVLHKCDNPACFNPDHLFLGTQEDNMADMKAKGRADRTKKLKGSQKPGAKLDESDIPVIRELITKGVNDTRIAKMYGLKSPETIRQIRLGNLWRHV